MEKRIIQKEMLEMMTDREPLIIGPSLGVGPSVVIATTSVVVKRISVKVISGQLYPAQASVVVSTTTWVVEDSLQVVVS